MPARDIKNWEYTDDNGNVYRRGAGAWIVSQVNGSSAVKVGGAAADTNSLKWPSSLKPRVAKVYDAVSGTRRNVVCFDTTCDLWAVAGTTIQLNLGQPSVLTTFTRYGVSGERGRDTADLTTP